ncbi:MAG: FHA domain-containing protein [Thermoleophilaceae bacterium]|nr:FHA domain-containing protein [Thermoleophilaceae bacterium]
MRDLRRYEAGSPAAEPVEAPNPARGRNGGPDPRAGARPRLEVVAALGRDPGTTFDVSEGATLGRSNGADIRIDDPYASSAHARIFARGGFMYVEDMGSTNGTYLNGRQLREPERLKRADVIRIGDSEYRYEE